MKRKRDSISHVSAHDMLLPTLWAMVYEFLEPEEQFMYCRHEYFHSCRVPTIETILYISQSCDIARIHWTHHTTLPLDVDRQDNECPNLVGASQRYFIQSVVIRDLAMVLKWAIHTKYQFDAHVINRWAAQQGRVEILLTMSECKKEWNHEDMIQAAVHGQFDVIEAAPRIDESFRDRDFEKRLGYHLIESARTDDHWKIVKHLWSRGYRWDCSAMVRKIIEKQDIELLEWALSAGVTFTESAWQTVLFASPEEEKEIIQTISILKQHNVPWSSSTPFSASINKNWQALIHLLSIGCPATWHICNDENMPIDVHDHIIAIRPELRRPDT